MVAIDRNYQYFYIMLVRWGILSWVLHGEGEYQNVNNVNKRTHCYAEAEKCGFKFEPSHSTTYWSTQAMIQSLVNDIIAPYFNRKKEELGLPSKQCSLWMIDCWLVHKSKEFCDWIKKTHPTIIISYIPGGCTGVWQPLDVGIQRVLKQSMKRSS